MPDEPSAVLVVPPVAGYWRSLGGGLWAPRHFAARWDDPAQPYVADVYLYVGSDGEVAVTHVAFAARFTGDDLTVTGELVALDARRGADLSRLIGTPLQLPLAHVKDRALSFATRRGMVAEPGTMTLAPHFTDRDPFVVERVDERGSFEHLADARIASERPKRRSPRVLTDALLAEVAQVVHDARAEGIATRRAVADHFRIPMNTARNWIQEARRRGLLAPTEDEPRPIRKKKS
jgi:hypothetical protein